MNLPNKLTVSRFLLTIAFVAAIYSTLPFHETMALALFVVASITDYYDGMIARRDKLITNFGILMDPLVDKILVCSAFIAFVGRGWLPAWMAVIIVARELAVTGMRLLAASKNVVLSAEALGKHKTTMQIIAIICTLIRGSYMQWGEGASGFFALNVFGMPWVALVTVVAQWLAVLLTLLSGASYMWRNRHLYMQDVG
ncbi:MAG TPA: CDP-diacylglycerol--glycerol-3-phosphate 3-phosphatidyltransferase [Verrucomicrobiae bacterium]|nr:CDP-diacylglycerol--glycerol-3-phosphate 3-phosphatidyltransferase [Verrucomicrobiae bacterium]